MGDDGDEEANKLCCVLKFVRVDGFVSAILGEVFDLTSTNKSSVFRVVWPNLHPTIVYIDIQKNSNYYNFLFLVFGNNCFMYNIILSFLFKLN